MNLFDLFATISLDSSQYDKGIEQAETKGNKLAGALKTALTTTAKVTASAIGASATGIGALVKMSVEEYANYEQLVGGVETLFKDSADTIMDYANSAYKTAGLSANDYMETVTSFSASLLQGLAGDTEAAAQYADMAIVDMSDNANKMGTSMELIQNAYQGFAKQNYTMLDNLKLGYGGTQEEMARLINDSGVLGDTITVTAKTVNDVSFDKIIEAIHVVQTEMDITGTTSKEASSTIAGSVASMKAAWTNLITGIADENADFEQLVEEFVDTVGVTANNIIPRVEVALEGAGKLVDRLVPIIIEKVPEIIRDKLPKITSSGVNIIKSLVQGMADNSDAIADGALDTMNTLIDGIVEMLPEIIVTGTLLLGKLAVGLIEAIPDLIAKIPEIVKAIVQGFIDRGGEFLQIGKNIVSGIIDGLASAWNRITSWIGAQPLNVGGETVRVNGSHASGLDYVPYDGYVAKLHRGEMVLTRDEAIAVRNGAVGASVSVVQNIYSKAQTAADLMEEARYQQERAVYLGD